MLKYTEMSKKINGLSVITPVKDDVRIHKLIENFRKINFSTRLEFLIICNGSEKLFVNQILKNAKNINNLKVYSLEKANMAIAINFGVEKAKYPNVVMIDSDCTVNKDTFKLMAKALNSHPVVRGVVVFKGSTFFSKLSAKLRTHIYEKESELFFTPNTGFQRNVFNKVGNFKEFPNNRGHTYDSEWGYRASKAGIKLMREQKAKILHYCHTNPTNEIKVTFNYGQGRAYCYREGLLGKKTFKNFLKAAVIPTVFDKNETFVYNIFVVFYVITWNLGFLREIVFQKLP